MGVKLTNMQISDSEKLIMDVLWQESPLTARRIIDKLDSTVDWHEKTVKTLLNRLLKKQAVSFEKRGREYHYYPQVNELDYVQQASATFLDKVFKGSVSGLISAFAKKEKLSAQDIERLKQLLKEMEQ